MCIMGFNGKITYMETKSIQKAIYFHCKCRQHEYMVSNKHLLKWFECDFISISKAGLLTEYEIKQSRSDFRRDFTAKKVKHAWFEGKRNNKLFIKDNQIVENVNTIPKNEAYMISEYNMGDFVGPNYFYYVCPKDLLKAEEIPPYAGLIYVHENATNTPRLSFEVKSPLLHKVKTTEEAKINILKRFMYDYWNNTYEKR